MMSAHPPRLPDQHASSLFLAPSRTVVTSFQPKSHTFEDGDWVLCLATCRARHSISVAVSNGEVQVYDPERLQRVSAYPTRGPLSSDASISCVTDLRYHHSASLDNSASLDGHQDNENEVCGSLLWATNQSGSVQLYDLRQPAPAASAQLPSSSPAWTVSIGHGGTVAAVGGNRKIHFLDVRSFTSQQPPAPTPWLGCYRDAHSDHVVSVRYVSDATLLSGGEDGVVAVFDTSRTNESDALRHMWNVGSPVRKVGIMANVASGLLGASPTAVWCLTGNETLSLWQPDADHVHDFADLRHALTATLGQHVSSEASSTIVAPPAIEYLIDAQWDPHDAGLLLAAGNARGEAAVFRLQSHRSGDDPTSPIHSWTPCHLLAGGHRGVVRSLQHYSESVMFSVGEDARLCEWNRRAASASFACDGGSRIPAAAAVGGGPVRRPRGGRHNLGPY